MLEAIQIQTRRTGNSSVIIIYIIDKGRSSTQAVPWSLKPFGHSRFDQLRQLYVFNPVVYNIVFGLSKMGQRQLVPAQGDPMKHMEAALDALHPAFEIALPEDTYIRAALWQQRLGHEIAQ